MKGEPELTLKSDKAKSLSLFELDSEAALARSSSERFIKLAIKFDL